MKTNLFSAKNHAKVGIGGWRCTCCGPAPKHRGVVSKKHQRKINRILEKLERDVQA